MEPQFEVLPPGRRPPVPPGSRPKRGGLMGGIAAVGAILLKFGASGLVLLKTGGSMLLSIGAYSLLFGWKLAAGIVVLILVHEMGHFVAAKLYRIPVSAPMFIPFLGAYVMLKERPMNPWSNGVISFAGPLAGTLGGWVCLYAGVMNELPWLVAVASYTFLLNGFNILPIPRLDGSFVWIAFVPKLTPTMRLWQRAAMALMLAGLLALIVSGFWGAQEELHAAVGGY